MVITTISLNAFFDNELTRCFLRFAYMVACRLARGMHYKDHALRWTFLNKY